MKFNELKNFPNILNELIMIPKDFPPFSKNIFKNIAKKNESIVDINSKI